MAMPRLLPVTNTVDLPNVKITHSGITILHQRGAKSRYGGSSSHAVDITGKLWEKKKEMIKSIYPERLVEGKKNAPVAADANKEVELNDEYTDFLNNLPTHEREFLTSLTELSTQKESPPQRTYRVKKTEVRQRILAHVSARRRSFAELYFWTLTFPQGTTDDIIYQIFNIWLTTLRSKDKFGRRFLKEYLWIAERQGNGTIHFHIAIPHQMPVKYANGVMQTILRTFAKRGEIPFSVFQCKKYNGIHLAKDKSKRTTNFATKKGSHAITHYLTKYLTKNNDKFTRLAWHNSRGFANMFTCIYTTKRHFYSMGVSRRGALGSWQVVEWKDCLEEDKNKWFPKRGDQEDKEESERRRQAGTDYFQFIPWGHAGPPENIIRHLAELNGYCLDNFRKSKLN